MTWVSSSWSLLLLVVGLIPDRNLHRNGSWRLRLSHGWSLVVNDRGVGAEPWEVIHFLPTSLVVKSLWCFVKKVLNRILTIINRISLGHIVKWTCLLVKCRWKLITSSPIVRRRHRRRVVRHWLVRRNSYLGFHCLRLPHPIVVIIACLELWFKCAIFSLFIKLNRISRFYINGLWCLPLKWLNLYVVFLICHSSWVIINPWFEG